MPMPSFSLADFDFDLPPELIAQHPMPERSASRLLDGTGAQAVDRVFRDLPGVLQRGDLLVFNATKVIKARLFGHKDSGGAVEVLVERVAPPGVSPQGGRLVASDPPEGSKEAWDLPASSCEVWAHVRASKPPRPGSTLHLADAFDAEVLGRGGPDGALYRLRFPVNPFTLLEAHGHVPLPPYITHADDADDAARYQSVFASRPGAVAAPTASLHFDAGLLAALGERGIATAGVTLHVGAGTFQPVRVADLAAHRMHSEWFEVSAATVAAIEATRTAGGRIVAVGTTSVRSLESAAQSGSLQPTVGETDIFITPGFEFRVVDMLVTNFHLPRSTLLMLVSAFAGHDRVRALYRHAIAQGYRFFSYGDAMLLEREPKGEGPRLRGSTGAAIGEEAGSMPATESTRC